MNKERKQHLKDQIEAEVRAIKEMNNLEVELLNIVDKIDGEIWLFKSEDNKVMHCSLPGHPSSLIYKDSDKLP